MMKSTKAIFASLTALVLVFLMSVSVLAAPFTKGQATDKALSDAGLSASQVRRLFAEYDDGGYEIKFTAYDGTRYEYEISGRDGRIKEASADYAYAKNYSSKKVSKAKAYKAVAKASGKKLSVVKSGTCRLKRDDGEWVYKIKFRSGSYKYEYEVLAPTGKVIEYDKEYTRK